MFRFRLDIAGEVQMDRGIARFSDGISDYRPIWPMIEEEFYALEERQFETEGVKGGEKWPELSAEYAGWKAAHYPGKPILQRSGDLVASLTSGTDPNAVRVRERKTLTLGAKVPYAIYHQSPAPRKVLPRRPEIMIPESTKRYIMRELHGYLVQMATQSGFRRGLRPTDVTDIVARGRWGKSVPSWAKRV